LIRAQNPDGGWGGGPGVPSSIEETALAMSGLAAGGAAGETETERAVRHGLAWLNGATAEGTVFPTSPIGLYFARLWYAEELYPIIFATGAVGALPVTQDHISSG
jgi:squalene-hopene/tetraprenyl-beta-curcumene cyclase